MRYLACVVAVVALGVMGCNETTGSTGSGGSVGMGGGGAGGVDGIGGVGGVGGDFLAIDYCLDTPDYCQSLPVEPHEPCCRQEVPDQANACDGMESTENPSTCTGTGGSVVYRLTFMEVEEDCNLGYSLDRCQGETCTRGALASPEGADGVDNGLAGIPSQLAVGGGADLATLNRLFSESLCGIMDSRGAGDHDCLREVPATEIRFVIDANPAENCANVVVHADLEQRAHVLHLSDDGCASGTLGTIPLRLWAWGVPGSLDNTIVRMTLSPAGFSHGRLGATLDEHTAAMVLEVLLDPSLHAFGQFYDINLSTPQTHDQRNVCNAISATLRIGGVAEPAP